MKSRITRCLCPLLVMLALACQPGLRHPGSISMTSRPHCGDEVTMLVSTSEVHVTARNNCGGADSFFQRPLESDEWERIVSTFRTYDFGGLPETIRLEVADSSEVPIVADDTEVCITFDVLGEKKTVCGETYAIDHTKSGERFRNIAAALNALRFQNSEQRSR